MASITNYVMLLNIDHACTVHFLLEGKLSSSLSIESCVFVDGVLRAQNVRCSKRVLEKLQIANLRQKRRASSEVSLSGGGESVSRYTSASLV